jgi:hypothetical protein
MKQQPLNKEFLRMQKIAGLITESKYNEYVLILEDEIIDEGIKDWIVRGLIALTTLGGVGKVYQMDQEAKLDQQNKIEYYNKFLEKEVTKMDKTDLMKIGSDINQRTKARAISRKASSDEIDTILSDYAEEYMKAHPEEFAIGIDGGIYWTKTAQ